MTLSENISNTLEDYKTKEIQFHRELMNSCRKYMNHLSIVSILGILDIVKQEAIDLEQATKFVPTEKDNE